MVAVYELWGLLTSPFRFLLAIPLIIWAVINGVGG